MILTENKLEKLVCGQLFIDQSRPYQFEAHFKLIQAHFTWSKFRAKNFYLLWFGIVMQDDVKFYFVCHVDSEMAIILPKDIFDYEKTVEVLRVYCGRFYYKILGSDSKERLIPMEWFDWNKMCQSHYFAEMKIPQKGNLIMAKKDEKWFLAWIFYYGNQICNVFNIEDGVWMEAHEISDKRFVVHQGFYLGSIKLQCYEKKIEKAQRQNFYK